jgi:hypothetical protein
MVVEPSLTEPDICVVVVIPARQTPATRMVSARKAVLAFSRGENRGEATLEIGGRRNGKGLDTVV